MADRTAEVFVKINDNSATAGRRIGSNLDRGSTQAAQGLSRLDRVARKADAGLDRFANRYTTIIGGIAVAKGSKELVDYDTRIRSLANAADLTAEGMANLRNEVLNTAFDKRFKLDPDQILDAVDKIVEKTGDLELARENFENIATAIRGTGASGTDIGALTGELSKKFDLTTPEQIAEALAILTVQGKEGAFELKNLATQGERLFAAFGNTGGGGIQGVRELGALMQMIRQGTGSAEQATTAFERMLDTLFNDKSGELQKAGIKIWDEKALANGEKVARSTMEIIEDILTASKGDTEILGKIFDIQAKRAINPFAQEFRKSGGIQSAENYKNVVGDIGVLQRDAARNAQGLAAALQSVQNALFGLADDTLSEPLQKVADALNDIDPETLKFAIALAAGTGGALFGASKVSQGAKLFMPAGGAASAGAAAVRAGAALEIATAMSKSAGTFVLATAAFETAVRMFGVLSDSEKSGLDKAAGISEIIAEQTAGLGTGLALAGLGAQLGTMVFPGVGSAVGALLLGTAGYFGGKEFVSEFIDLMNDDKSSILFGDAGDPGGGLLDKLGLDIEVRVPEGYEATVKPKSNGVPIDNYVMRNRSGPNTQ